MFYKPNAPGTVVIEVDREFDKPEMLLGMHSWSEFLLKPMDEEVGKASKVFWCTYNTDRWVRKHGWKRVDIEEHWFQGWSPNSTNIRFPYPKTTYCDIPSEAKSIQLMCRPLPRAFFPDTQPTLEPPVRAATLVSVKDSVVSSDTTLQSRRKDKIRSPRNTISKISDTSSNRDAQPSPTLATSFEAISLKHKDPSSWSHHSSDSSANSAPSLPATDFRPETQCFPRGHHRRASGGSRERGMVGPTWGAARSSLYPTSPSGSPARLAEPLLGPGLGSGQTSRINNMRDDVSGGYGSGYSSGGSCGGTPVVPGPNVTTTATADASMKRRINDAKFVCPVPGCGSTFTRHFNLKGHLRSHNDEKPFQCKWPGCGKGFARQHDCKRHEQLHSNHRPFICDGCRKPFARLDALNRHLRSEGGSGCAKAQELSPEQQAAPGSPKAEPDAGNKDDWNTCGDGQVLM